MGLRGPLPKEGHDRLRRGDPAYPATDLDARPIDAPELPKAKGYLPETIAWYATWCTSPQASQFLSTDWQRLHMIAPLVERYFRDVNDPRPAIVRAARGLLSEIAKLERQLGATAEDRLRLRWRLQTQERDDAPEEAKPKRKTSRAQPDPRLALVDGKKE